MCYEELEVVAEKKEDCGSQNWLAFLDPGYDYQDLKQRDQEVGEMEFDLKPMEKKSHVVGIDFVELVQSCQLVVRSLGLQQSRRCCLEWLKFLQIQKMKEQRHLLYFPTRNNDTI